MGDVQANTSVLAWATADDLYGEDVAKRMCNIRCQVDENEVQFKRVREFQAEPIIALYQEAGRWTESPKARADIPVLISGSFCFIAVIDRGQLIGMGRALSDGVSDAYIHDIFVTECYRKRGIGRELVRRLAVYCLENELEWVGLLAEPGTESFYRELGFEQLENYQPMILNPQRMPRR